LEALPKCAFPERILTEEYSFLNRKCQAGRTIVAVSCIGDVRPCAHNPVSYGNILIENLKDIWGKMSDWRSAQYVPEKCKECTWLSRCNGGCRTNAKTLSGKWNTRDAWTTETPIKVLPPKNNTTIVLSAKTKLQANLNYRFRQEEENVFVIYNTENDIYFMVNSKLYDFIMQFIDGDIFYYNDLLCKYNVNIDNKSFYDTIYFLTQKKILKIIE
jgi:radical SAM protein with 4Fe4S-binding SPASM domain